MEILSVPILIVVGTLILMWIDRRNAKRQHKSS